MLNIIKSNRDKPLLNVDGYLFYINKTSTNVYWTCREKTTMSKGKLINRCPSTFVTNGSNPTDTFIQRPTNHNHEPYRNEINRHTSGLGSLF